MCHKATFTAFAKRREFGRMKVDRLKRLKERKKESQQLRPAVADLVLEW